MSKCMALPHIGWPSNSIKSENGSIIIILLHRYQSLIGVTPWDYDHLKSDAVHQVTYDSQLKNSTHVKDHTWNAIHELNKRNKEVY